MPCCLLALTAFFPRIALLFMAVFGYAGRAYDSFLWPLLGFFFMPYTTCAYAIGINEHGSLDGWALALLIVAVVLDAGHMGGGAYGGRSRWVQTPR